MVLNGPTSANGYNWYQLQISGMDNGWVAADFLEPVREPVDAPLRRRGVDSTMFYGVAPATQDKPLSAHVWVRCGELDVLGTELASSFALLATFPAQAPETISST